MQLKVFSLVTKPNEISDRNPGPLPGPLLVGAFDVLQMVSDDIDVLEWETFICPILTKIADARFFPSRRPIDRVVGHDACYERMTD